jgi:hypothetical protein
MFNGALCPLLEKHQGANRLRIGGVAAQQVQVQRHTYGRDTRQEPGR